MKNTFWVILGAVHATARLNIIGLLFALVVFLELFLRGLGLVDRLANHPFHVGCATILRRPDNPVHRRFLDCGAAFRQTILMISKNCWRAQYPKQPFRRRQFSIGGFNSSQGVRRLAENLPTYQPAIVIVLIAITITGICRKARLAICGSAN